MGSLPSKATKATSIHPYKEASTSSSHIIRNREAIRSAQISSLPPNASNLNRLPGQIDDLCEPDGPDIDSDAKPLILIKLQPKDSGEAHAEEAGLENCLAWNKHASFTESSHILSFTAQDLASPSTIELIEEPQISVPSFDEEEVTIAQLMADQIPTISRLDEPAYLTPNVPTILPPLRSISLPDPLSALRIEMEEMKQSWEEQRVKYEKRILKLRNKLKVIRAESSVQIYGLQEQLKAYLQNQLKR
ncbi:hypothetical protein HDU79_001880 [Rhizoclosmatium sp. JEL0117]|nr:hypothetical protein HDU79_001880 [Rhizoclosmatium sp. JEL0117]